MSLSVSRSCLYAFSDERGTHSPQPPSRSLHLSSRFGGCVRRSSEEKNEQEWETDRVTRRLVLTVGKGIREGQS
jgi:hypothetical protein